MSWGTFVRNFDQPDPLDECRPYDCSAADTFWNTATPGQLIYPMQSDPSVDLQITGGYTTTLGGTIGEFTPPLTAIIEPHPWGSYSLQDPGVLIPGSCGDILGSYVDMPYTNGMQCKKQDFNSGAGSSFHASVFAGERVCLNKAFTYAQFPDNITLDWEFYTPMYMANDVFGWQGNVQSFYWAVVPRMSVGGRFPGSLDVTFTVALSQGGSGALYVTPYFQLENHQPFILSLESNMWYPGSPNFDRSSGVDQVYGGNAGAFAPSNNKSAGYWGQNVYLWVNGERLKLKNTGSYGFNGGAVTDPDYVFGTYDTDTIFTQDQAGAAWQTVLQTWPGANISDVGPIDYWAGVPYGNFSTALDQIGIRSAFRRGEKCISASISNDDPFSWQIAYMRANENYTPPAYCTP